MARCYASALVVAALVMLIIDYFYLSKVAGPIFSEQVKLIQGGSPTKFNMIAAGFSYMALLLGVIVLTVPRVREEHMLCDSILYGVIYGFAVYGVFDFTNMAIFKEYKIENAILDVLWGMVLMSIVTYVGSYASYKWKWFVS